MKEEWFIAPANHRSSGDPIKIRGVCGRGWRGIFFQEKLNNRLDEESWQRESHI